MSGHADGLVDLEDLDVLQFVIHPLAQHLLVCMQAELLDGPYRAFGKTEGSEEQFNLVFPKTYGSDRRKPVSARFQDFCEAVYWPLVNALLFGVEGWEQVRRHLTAFKVNTLQISADEFYYGQDIYHFHLDHKIGRLEPKDQMQKQTMRVIFSTVPAALERHASGEVAALAERRFDSTVYLRAQPPHGFHQQDELHTHLQARFPECGLSAGRERPLYQVGDDELYRALPGEVCVHRSHPGRPIHAETNPCPPERCLYVLDWEDRRNLVYSDSAAAPRKGGPKVERV